MGLAAAMYLSGWLLSTGAVIHLRDGWTIHLDACEAGQSLTDDTLLVEDLDSALSDVQDPRGNGDAKKPPTPEHTGVHALFRNLKDDVLRLPSMPNLYIALVGGRRRASTRSDLQRSSQQSLHAGQ